MNATNVNRNTSKKNSRRSRSSRTRSARLRRSARRAAARAPWRDGAREAGLTGRQPQVCARPRLCGGQIRNPEAAEEATLAAAAESEFGESIDFDVEDDCSRAPPRACPRTTRIRRIKNEKIS